MNTHNTLAEDLLSSCRESLAPSPLSFPDITDRGFWEGIGEDYRKELIQSAEELLSRDYPALTATDYKRFSLDGNREIFEEKYFTRRRMLNTLVLGECAEGRGRFLDKALDGLYLILEETSWCLPAHNTLIRDAKQEVLPDKTRPVIDLFAAETAAAVGLGEYLLRPAFRKISPSIQTYVNYEIRTRILDPYLNRHFWWMGNGLEPMCNWTPWITQNVLLALFTGEEERVTKEQALSVLRQAASSIGYFLDEYGEDGCCNEGAQYYEHAGLCLFGCIDVLNRITGDAFLPMYEAPLVKNIASYLRKMYVGNGYYVNYADCSPFPGPRTVRDYLFALHTGNEAYAVFAASDVAGLPLKERLLPLEINLYYRLLQAMHHDEMLRHAVSPGHQGLPQPEDSFFPSTGLMIARDAHLTLAAKAGDNGDSHNHNDVGSITVYKDHRPYLIDLGVETYTAKTFSDRRYEIWTMQSAYHNTVNFAGRDSQSPVPSVLQRDGKEYAAGESECSLLPDRAVLSMELAGAYGDERIRSAKRRVSLIKNREILIEDHFELSPELTPVLSLITYEEPVVEKCGDRRVRIRVGSLGTILAEGIGRYSVETCPVRDERLKKAWKHDCFRILLGVSESSCSLSVT